MCPLVIVDIFLLLHLYYAVNSVKVLILALSLFWAEYFHLDAPFLVLNLQERDDQSLIVV